MFVTIQNKNKTTFVANSKYEDCSKTYRVQMLLFVADAKFRSNLISLLNIKSRCDICAEGLYQATISKLDGDVCQK